MKKEIDTTCTNCGGSGKVCAFCGEPIETKSSGDEGLDWCANCGIFEPDLMDCSCCNGTGQLEESEVLWNSELDRADANYKIQHGE
jgi:formamidopyrimidine-DNA glycosylase